MATYDVKKITTKLDALKNELDVLKKTLDERKPDDCVTSGSSIKRLEKELAKLL